MNTYTVKVECMGELETQVVKANSVSEAFHKVMDLYPAFLVNSERVVIVSYTRSPK
jgi:hypothetical protein